MIVVGVVVVVVVVLVVLVVGAVVDMVVIVVVVVVIVVTSPQIGTILKRLKSNATRYGKPNQGRQLSHAFRAPLGAPIVPCVMLAL